MTRITLTAEQAQQIEEALFGCRPTVISHENWNDVYKARAIITAARAQEQAEQEPVIDLSKVRHEYKCCYWDDETFCNCGADSHALLEWHRNNKAAPVQQTSQKPVGVIKLWESETGFQNADYEFYRLPIGTHKLYAAPVRTKDLTDDEIHKCMNGNFYNALDFARAVIAKFKEKNK